MVTKRIIFDASKTKPPNMTKWKNTYMLQKHDFRDTIKEICNSAIYGNLIRVGLIGMQSSGKSTMSKSIAHAIHETMLEDHKIPFKVRIINERDLHDLQKIRADLNTGNYVLIFDDISNLDDTKRSRNIIREILRIGGTDDAKIIMIYNYIYSKILHKYLGQGAVNFEYFLTVGFAEEDDIWRILGKKSSLIKRFKEICNFPFYARERFVLSDGKQKISYKYYNPFIPVLFNGLFPARIIVSPTREWQDPDCDICNSAEAKDNTS